MLKINKNLVSFSIVFLSLGLIFSFIIQKLTPLLDHATYYCQSFIAENIVRVPYLISIIPITFLLTILLISLLKLIKVTVTNSRLRSRLNRGMTQNEYITRVAEKLSLGYKTHLIQSDEKFALCLGFLKPKIYISTGLVAVLSEDEIEAVLRHEQYHLENLDSFTLTIASTAHSIFPLFPLLKDLIKKYKIEREIAADNFAIKYIGGKESIIMVLKKLLKTPTVGSVYISGLADQETLEPRIHSLLERPYHMRHFRIKNLFISLISFVTVSLFITLPIYAEIHHDHHDVLMVCSNGQCLNSCTTDSAINELYKKIPLK